jgi:PIN domain nuclease of toxin-antitoxin system
LRLLLDTHVWIWMLLEPQRIAPGAVRQLEDSDNELWLSPISVWEALLLLQRGRVRVGLEPGVWFAQALRAMPVRDANLTREIVLASRSVDLHHEDPADRLIAATAAVLGLTLVTADERLLASTHWRTLASR